MAYHPYDTYYFPPPPPPPMQLQSDRSDINTLFVSGLPDDVKAREIHNLFRRRHGFDSCQLKYTGRGDQVVAFATFTNHQSAIAALHELNGAKFDLQTGAVLHIELARSNSRRVRKPGDGVYVVIDKRTNDKAATGVKETSNTDGESDSDEPSEADNPDPGNNDDSATTKSVDAEDAGNAIIAAPNEQPEKPADGGLPGCSTLFIANLGPNCTEYELKQVLSPYPGFNVLKMRAMGGMPVAFADFGEIEQANKVMEDLQGSTLPSSDRGGMHIEYAKSKMRKGSR